MIAAAAMHRTNEARAMHAPENPPTSPDAGLPSTGPADPPGGTPPAGRIGRYWIERVLGEGGFGRVYLARDDELGRLVAVKVPHPGLLSTPQSVSLFLAEAKVLAGLDHPHVVPVYDAGRTD